MKPFPAKLLVALLLLCAPLCLTAGEFFNRALPVWPAERERVMNLTVGFRAEFSPPPHKPVLLRLAGSSLYRVYVNGRYAGQGPARAAHGFYRVDELDITGLVDPSRTNVVAVEVAGYNANSYYLLDQPAFLQAEIAAGGKVLAATDADGAFRAVLIPERVRKTERYSFQRTFIEYWKFSPGWDSWRTELSVRLAPVQLAVQAEKRLIHRGVPYPDYEISIPQQLISSGLLQRTGPPSEPWLSRAYRSVGPDFKGYPADSLELAVSLLLQEFVSSPGTLRKLPWRSMDSLALEAGHWEILDLGTNLSGMIGFGLAVSRPSRLVVTFDEVLSGSGDVDWKRLGCINAVTLDLEPGKYSFESFEPYTLRFLKFSLLDGACTVIAPYLRQLANPLAGRARFEASDRRLERLFEAGRQTFRQNAVDIFTDCPSRERAGWLCDSYFTARASAALTGSAALEHCFLENFVLPDSFAHLPAGMLPMCYPADHTKGVFIPNWALWFVLELEEYYLRTGDRALVDAARERVLALFNYFEPYLNGNLLLEHLDSWVFIEWSRANDFVQDVNYPTNMLYAAALDAAGGLYDERRLSVQAHQVRSAVARLAMGDDFFVDNARDTFLGYRNTSNRTEVCQYFAFYFGIATPQSHPHLWSNLVKKFGPGRDSEKIFPAVFPAAPFIGKLLRLEVLSRAGLAQQVLDEALEYYLPMAGRTGTLWEYDGAAASCNHGFASYLSALLLRDVLGLAAVDPVARELTVRLGGLELDWCRGARPVPDGEIWLSWQCKDGRVVYSLSVPDGWAARVESRDGTELVRVK